MAEENKRLKLRDCPVIRLHPEVLEKLRKHKALAQRFEPDHVKLSYNDIVNFLIDHFDLANQVIKRFSKETMKNAQDMLNEHNPQQ